MNLLFNLRNQSLKGLILPRTGFRCRRRRHLQQNNFINIDETFCPSSDGYPVDHPTRRIKTSYFKSFKWIFQTYGIIVGPESGILINSIAGHGDEHGVGGGSHRVNRWQHVTCVVHQDLRGTRHPIVNLKFEIHLSQVVSSLKDEWNSPWQSQNFVPRGNWWKKVERFFLTVWRTATSSSNWPRSCWENPVMWCFRTRWSERSRIRLAD